MIKINGKNYNINLDITWGTYKRMKKLQDNPDDDEAVEKALSEILRPRPTKKDIEKFKLSDIRAIFEEFARQEQLQENEFQKKLSQ